MDTLLLRGCRGTTTKKTNNHEKRKPPKGIQSSLVPVILAPMKVPFPAFFLLHSTESSLQVMRTFQELVAKSSLDHVPCSLAGLLDTSSCSVGSTSPSTHSALGEGTSWSLGKSGKTATQHCRTLWSHPGLEGNSDIFAREVTHLLHFTKSSHLEHLLFSAHRAIPNTYKNYLQLAATEGYNFGVKHNNDNNNNLWCYLKLMFQFRELHLCFL